MPQKARYHATTGYFERLRSNLTVDGVPVDMGKQERKDMVLKFLADYRLALPPAVLYRNLRLRENATFSEKSLGNYLSELEESGLVKRVDPEALADRHVEPIGEDDRGYYLITEAGADVAPDSVSFR